jgi:transposase
MRVHHNVCCGIDVHKKSVTACLMWGPADKEPEFEIRRFGTMTRDLQKLAEWLKQAGCEAATMESAGSYWSQYGTGGADSEINFSECATRASFAG